MFDLTFGRKASRKFVSIPACGRFIALYDSAAGSHTPRTHLPLTQCFFPHACRPCLPRPRFGPARGCLVGKQCLASLACIVPKRSAGQQSPDVHMHHGRCLSVSSFNLACMQAGNGLTQRSLFFPCASAMLHAVRSAGGARPALPPHVGVAGDWAASRRSATPSGGCFNYRHRCTKPPHSRQHGGSAGRAGTSPIDPAARPSMLGKTGSCIAAARFDNMPPAASAAASLAALTLSCAAPVAKPASPRSPAAAASHGAAVQTDRHLSLLLCTAPSPKEHDLG